MKELLDIIFPTLSDELIIVFSRKEDLSKNKYQRTLRPHAFMVDHGGHVYRRCIYQL